MNSEQLVTVILGVFGVVLQLVLKYAPKYLHIRCALMNTLDNIHGDVNLTTTCHVDHFLVCVGEVVDCSIDTPWV